MVKWRLNDFLLGPTGLGSDSVDGFYLDDNYHNTSQPNASWQPPIGYCDHSPIGGPSEMDFHCVDDMGLAQNDTTAITDGWKSMMAVVEQTLIAHDSWAWAFFSSVSIPTTTEECTSFFTTVCTQGVNWDLYSKGGVVQWTLNHSAPSPTSPLPSPGWDLAAFLTFRGERFWLGYGWVNCNVPYDFPEALNGDYGEPTGTCSETAPGSGVFTRAWTKATSKVDCNAMVGSIDAI